MPTFAFDERVSDGLIQKVRVEGWAFVPDPLPPKLDWCKLRGEVCGVLIDAERGIAKLDGRASKLPNPHLLMGPFSRREARMSSMIEDTYATPEEIAQVQAGARVERDDPREVFNYMRALQHGFSSELPLSGRLIKEMHGILLEGVRGGKERPGQYRIEQNYIGIPNDFAVARFVPPPSGSVLEQCMSDLERAFNATTQEVPALVSVALTHYQFESIHPFRDGNGRIGRLLMVLSLCKQGLLSQPLIYLSEYIESRREEYRALLLDVSVRGNWKEWITFVLEAIAVQSNRALASADRLLELQEDLAGRVTERRASALLRPLIDHLFLHPVVDVDEVSRVLKVSETAARRHIDRLTAKDILVEIPSSARDRKTRDRKNWYAAKPILDAIEADPPPALPTAS